jgi:hypothetical protein
LARHFTCTSTKLARAHGFSTFWFSSRSRSKRISTQPKHNHEDQDQKARPARRDPKSTKKEAWLRRIRWEKEETESCKQLSFKDILHYQHEFRW